MEEFSPEARKLYEILRAKTQEEYEIKFLAHKKEILDSIRIFMAETDKQFEEVNTNLASMQAQLGEDVASLKSSDRKSVV